jgi:hypothetical protein
LSVVDRGRCNTLVKSAINLWVSFRKAAYFWQLKQFSSSKIGLPWNFGYQQFRYVNMYMGRWNCPRAHN